MKVIILGAGFLGVSTAYFLGKKGYDVVVIDRQMDVANECSYANGAQLSYSHAEPWATPQMVRKAMMWIGKKDAPMKMSFGFDPHKLSWIMKFLSEANEKSVNRNMLSMMRIGLYSRQIMHELTEDEDINFHYRKNGILHVFYDEKAQQDAVRVSEFQKQKADIPYHIIPQKNLMEYEPALSQRLGRIHSGMVYSLDESGSMQEFTKGVAEVCANRYGVKFMFDTDIEDILHKGRDIHGVKTNKGVIKGDKYVMAMGAYSYMPLKKLGITVPIYPMKGYSLTAQIIDPSKAPSMSVTDTYRKVVVTRLGNTLRAAGTAEFAGYNHDIDYRRIKMLKDAMSFLFPAAANVHDGTPWACLRPSTPDGSPILGKVKKFDNLLLNTGHGTLGWTQGAGSAKIVADLIDNQELDINLTGLDASRYRC